MRELPLRLENEHLVATTGTGEWLVDTGGPTSFGRDQPGLGIGEDPVETSYMGLDTEMLCEYTGLDLTGLLGADVLSLADLTLDLPGGQMLLGASPDREGGIELPARSFMGIPLIDIEVGGESQVVFFDTGAPIGYLQSADLASFPDEGVYRDFYPGVGRFESETWRVPIEVGGESRRLRFGRLPGLLGMALMMGGASGIVGIELVQDRRAVYSAREGILWLQSAE